MADLSRYVSFGMVVLLLLVVVMMAAGGVDVKNVAHMFLLVHACSCSNSTVVRGSRSSGHGGLPTQYHRPASANL